MAFSYIPPRVASILTLGSYLFLLNVFDFFAQWVLSAGLLGQILVGIVFGSSLAGWLSLEWQGAFVDLGYVGLLLIVFEGESFLMPFLTPDGGMSTELPILVSMVPLATVIALTGLGTPIALSFLLTPMFGSPIVHSFAAGSALSSTSMGTVLAVLASSSFDLRPTRLGTALLGSAIFDDIVAFVLSSILEIIGNSGSNLGSSVGRVIGVTIGISLVAWLLAKFLGPVYRTLEKALWIQMTVMTVILLGLIAATGYAGTSVLFGAYIAGLVMSYLQEKDEFTLAFEHYVSGPLKYVLLPLFFGSIGYSIPFLSLWRGSVVWKGLVYALLMALGKGICGLWILVWPIRPEIGALRAKTFRGRIRQKLENLRRRSAIGLPGAFLIGAAMISRGEIGLLISQIAYHTSTPLLSEAELLITTWGIAVCTIIGPMGVGFVLRRWGKEVVRGGWE